MAEDNKPKTQEIEKESTTQAIEKPQKNKGGCPKGSKHKDRKFTPEVKALATRAFGAGLTQVQVAQIIGISDRYLRQEFQFDEEFYRQLNAERQIKHLDLAENLYQKAMGEGAAAVTAAMFWLRCRAGWKEPETPKIENVQGFNRLDMMQEALDEAKSKQFEESDFLALADDKNPPAQKKIVGESDPED